MVRWLAGAGMSPALRLPASRNSTRPLASAMHGGCGPLTAATSPPTWRRPYALAAPASAHAEPPAGTAPATKPPSARPVETRKSQLLRTYTSLLRSVPLILLFQHNSLTAVEWAAVRRELKKAVEAVPAADAAVAADVPPSLGARVELQVVRTNILNVALKTVEFYDAAAAQAHTPHVHDLSQAAYEAVSKAVIPPDSTYAQLGPLMVGPLALLTMPVVSPLHLAAALSVLAPVPGKFPAPTRRKCPGYHEASCQAGLAKLLLVGARVEGRIFDQDGVQWVGSLGGGLETQRARLVALLQAAGLGLTTTLEGSSRSLWLALHGRQQQLEEGAAGGEEDKQG